VGDVTDPKHGHQITVNGKQGQRTVLLITATPFLNRWLSELPRKNEYHAPLWSKLNSGE
jgi:hypothetical protein